MKRPLFITLFLALFINVIYPLAGSYLQQTCPSEELIDYRYDDSQCNNLDRFSVAYSGVARLGVN
jgi:hypothetical protein